LREVLGGGAKVGLVFGGELHFGRVEGLGAFGSKVEPPGGHVFGGFLGRDLRKGTMESGSSLVG